MIQRIQSLFLLGATIIAALLLFMPVATLVVPNDFTYEFYAAKVVRIGAKPQLIAYNWMSMILAIVTIILPLVTIFFYKKRTLQIRLCFVDVILGLGMLVLLWLQIKQRSAETGAEWFSEIAFVFPLIGIVLVWLAIHSIMKDVKMLKSFDRIR